MGNTAVILVVDEDKDHAALLADAFARPSARILTAHSRDRAFSLLETESVDLLVADAAGFELLDRAKQVNPRTEVVLIASEPSIDSCKEAIRRGAADYLAKPVDLNVLRGIASRVGRDKTRRTTPHDFVFEGVLSRSPAMQRVLHILRRVAPTDMGVLIEGESGTGKELTAHAIHNNSPRRDRAFLPLNCAGLSETLLESELFGHVKGAFTGAVADRKGLFEAADHGTLFLDEIGDMPLLMQAKLLRVLEDGLVMPVGATRPIVVDVRVLCATNHDLTKLVEENKFRQDLYFRVKGVSVTLPPLRARREDIEELFGFFLRQAADELGRDIHRITEPAMAVLLNYHWPGNIRQLRNVVRTMVVLCDGDTLDVADIPFDVHHVKRLAGEVSRTATTQPQAFLGQSLEDVERQHIAATLSMTKNNRAEAAKILKIGERTLYRKIKQYGL